MRFGVGFFATDETIAPAAFARMAEDRGFDSVFLTEHTHIPVDHSPYPAGGELPRWYKRTLDPFVALAAMAAVTERIRLGFGIALVAQRDPLVTAKEVASLDWISGGRVDFGVGAGWNQPETENHGTPFDRRFKVMREHVEAMRALWTQEEASYHGEFVAFDRVWSWPKPVQSPLPVYVGGHGKHVFDRVERYADGWMPMIAHDLRAQIIALRARKPDARVIFFGVPHKAEAVAEMEAAGVDECLFLIRTGPQDVVETSLDRAASAMMR